MIEERIETSLNETIWLGLDNIQDCDVDSEGYLTACEAVSKLLAEQRQLEQLKLEAKQKEEESSRETAHKLIDTGVGMIGIAAPLMLFRKCWREGMIFEQTGTFISTGMKTLTKLLRLKK